jgi:hypothetical protein
LFPGVVLCHSSRELLSLCALIAGYPFQHC